ncbi:MAG: Mth938-like domain-containing protein [Allosphingosinicella sp.]|uniref:Mth938-like domain-containing protein n=1 Tax=Allosphingosinicella sp. TaxID=2823234 RepID=UPI00392745FE
MMAPRFERDPQASGPVVQGFAAGGFTVDGGVYRALLLTPDSAHGWEPPALAELEIGHLEALLGGGPEFLLLGTGAKMAFPPRRLVRDLEARGIGIEAMDSRAAARAWGMLRAEDRRIVAALLPL